MRLSKFIPLGILLLAIPIFSQIPTPKPSFEVATVKLDTALEGRSRIADQPGGRFVVTRITLHALLQGFCSCRRIQFSGGPNWVDSDLWDIEAKAPEGTVLTKTRLGLPDAMVPMVESLLEERFQLKFHHEIQPLPVYELTMAKGGLKMKLSEDQSAPKPPDPGAPPLPPGTASRGGMRMGRGDFQGWAVSIDSVVDTLALLSGRPVIDKTGLKGLYDFKLQWTPDSASGSGLLGLAPGSPDVTPPSDPSGPSLFAAVQEQLGLKLDSAKAPLDVMVVDSVQRPKTN